MDLSDWEDVPPVSEGKNTNNSTTTLVLVGKTGSGKSATGNSILGSKAFVSRKSSICVTRTCELGKADRPDGRCIRVIDTPGIFDSSLDLRGIQREIGKCMELAGDGLHAILLVLSSGRFTPEELAAVDALEAMFGAQVLNYMLVVFTGGDDFETTLDEFLDESPTSLKDIITRCKNRKVLFDNRSKDKRTLEKQRSELLEIVDRMVIANSRIPYTSDVFEAAKARREAQESKETLESRLSLLEQRVPEKFKEQMEQEIAQLRAMAFAAEAKMEEQSQKAEEHRREAEAAKAQAEAEFAEQRRQAEAKLKQEQQRFEEEIRRREREFEEILRKNRCTIL